VTSILLTGASGFVGHPLVRALAAHGFHVHAVALDRMEASSADVTWHRADLLQPGSRQALLARLRPGHLLHAAWRVEHGKFWTAPENALWQQASLDLLDDFIAAGGQRAVFLGSCAEYDWNRKDTAPWREDGPCRPGTPYGVAKHALHLAAEKKAQSQGVSFAWARLFLMFGAGEAPGRLVPSLIAGLKAGREVALSSGRQIRDFSDTRDIAEALAGLAAGPVNGAVNVASGEAASIRQVAETLAGLLGADRNLLRFGALPDRAEPDAMVADVTRLRREAGVAAPPPLARRLAELIAG
jgi:nucleoside-diphosphate-sugar epimerase